MLGKSSRYQIPSPRDRDQEIGSACRRMQSYHVVLQPSMPLDHVGGSPPLGPSRRRLEFAVPTKEVVSGSAGTHCTEADRLRPTLHAPGWKSESRPVLHRGVLPVGEPIRRCVLARLVI